MTVLSLIVAKNRTAVVCGQCWERSKVRHARAEEAGLGHGLINRMLVRTDIIRELKRQTVTQDLVHVIMPEYVT